MSYRYLLLLIVAFAASKPAAADPSPWLRGAQSSASPGTEYWVRDWSGTLAVLLPSLEQSLAQAVSHPLFEDHLPERWSVLLDGSWNGASGYWSPKLHAPDSPDTPALLLRPETILDPRGGAQLIHELAHLVFIPKRPHEQRWVQEGTALLIESLVTSTLNPAFRHGFEEPETSLIADVSPLEDETAEARLNHYGHLLQYFGYLYRVCGEGKLLGSLLESRSPLAGIGFVDHVLRATHGNGEAPDAACASFEASFRYFQRARFSPEFNRASGYVHSGALRAVVRDVRVALPPWSASAYRARRCFAGDSALTGSRCLRVRMR